MTHITGLDSTDLGQGPEVGSCKHGNTPMDFMRGSKFPDQLNDCQLFKKDSTPLGYLF